MNLQVSGLRHLLSASWDPILKSRVSTVFTMWSLNTGYQFRSSQLSQNWKKHLLALDSSGGRVLACAVNPPQGCSTAMTSVSISALCEFGNSAPLESITMIYYYSCWKRTQSLLNLHELLHQPYSAHLKSIIAGKRNRLLPGSNDYDLHAVFLAVSSKNSNQ